jgi:hypothetical protein
MGDPAQIPPVGELDCEPFLEPEKYGIIVNQLTTIMRQKDGNPIIAASFMIRENLFKKSLDFSEFEDKVKLNIVNNTLESEREQLICFIQDVWSGPEIKADSFYYKIIAYRNSQVAIWNDLARSIYHNVKREDLPQILIGDYFITDKPVFHDDTILLNTSTDIKVLSISQDKKSPHRLFKNESIKYYECEVEYFDHIADKFMKTHIHILDNEHQLKYSSLMNKVKDWAQNELNAAKKKMFWHAYFAMDKCFARVSPAFAITAHKSQGSTFKNVIVDVNDILLSSNIEERNRILYTSLTRPSDTCTLIIKKTIS